jgi:LmbE family N-acetylglucosaminyl deacetylase
MIPAAMTARSVLVVAPHPDDEAIAAWGLMRRFQSRGARIEVLVVSDGAASHPGSQRWPVERLVAERRRETLRAMRMLGLAPKAVGFLGLADGELMNHPARLRRTLGRALRARARPQLVIGPELSDAHADHRAVAQALAALPRRGERRATYHVWPADAARGPRPCRVILKGAELAIKRRIIRSYRTQSGRITDAPTGFTLTHRHLAAFARPIECFAVQA